MKPTIRKPSKEEEIEASKWPIWEKEASEFPYEYDQTESCLIIDGEVSVIDETGEEFRFKEGDFVIFPKGFKCTWKIKKDVKKHYRFG